MKIVSFGDVHMATRNLDRMGEVMRDCDLVILSGDLTNFGGVDDARKVITDVRRACPAVLALPGNLDQREVIPFLEADGIALHGKGRVDRRSRHLRMRRVEHLAVRHADRVHRGRNLRDAARRLRIRCATCGRS